MHHASRNTGGAGPIRPLDSVRMLRSCHSTLFSFELSSGAGTLTPRGAAQSGGSARRSPAALNHLPSSRQNTMRIRLIPVYVLALSAALAGCAGKLAPEEPAQQEAPIAAEGEYSILKPGNRFAGPVGDEYVD